MPTGRLSELEAANSLSGRSVVAERDRRVDSEEKSRALAATSRDRKSPGRDHYESVGKMSTRLSEQMRKRTEGSMNTTPEADGLGRLAGAGAEDAVALRGREEPAKRDRWLANPRAERSNLERIRPHRQSAAKTLGRESSLEIGPREEAAEVTGQLVRREGMDLYDPVTERPYIQCTSRLIQRWRNMEDR
ncbi:unnamed protein product [Protopolystoma xenopodis]|uniref:Uncharacterized protein n=1 Tax=Protopolystoma xenopodis TaxID=117903 RepID=A0A448WG26_9PLAT|nr:unnamed protein product [Protopolystoma xenopodis]